MFISMTIVNSFVAKNFVEHIAFLLKKTLFLRLNISIHKE